MDQGALALIIAAVFLVLFYIARSLDRRKIRQRLEEEIKQAEAELEYLNWLKAHGLHNVRKREP